MAVPRRIGILGHTERAGVQRAAARLVTRLARGGRTARLASDLAGEMGKGGMPLAGLARWAQLLITLGGDGTALRGARAMAGRPGALLAINLGGLGFLTVADEPELDDAVRAALAGAWPIVPRRLVRAVVRRRGRIAASGLAMNDAVLKTAGGYSALHLRMSVLGTDVGHLVADGVICATASGSTAYSLSAGGPVLAPDVEAFVVTPVCAHTLGSRPLVISPRGGVRLRLLGAFDRAMLLFDGQETVDLERGDEVQVSLSRTTVRLVRNPGRPFGRSLQRKLGWQGSERRSL
ncbi:MAG: NAD(+)/NADH kinase [Candidatus Eisenbacteria bacterium]|uniref:NAD kinase n=1 Tax=Eiseniibacteriota bacterium TaxID=2212470 RepID=A0A9D6LB76_UNCEI|nr:NAD(+)/NADH kinase [Candidatus Eisenbacteria bacterium]MBI3540370.1 NAD(+)/NADH kinase [Candidatus Eisenbacteria bacterium]